jgi:hypothetical protein
MVIIILIIIIVHRVFLLISFLVRIAIYALEPKEFAPPWQKNPAIYRKTQIYPQISTKIQANRLD